MNVVMKKKIIEGIDNIFYGFIFNNLSLKIISIPSLMFFFSIPNLYNYIINNKIMRLYEHALVFLHIQM